MTYTEIGKKEGYTEESITETAEKLEWVEIIPEMKLPFSQGYAINEMIKEFKIKAGKIAYNGIIRNGNEEHGFYGIETTMGQRLYFADCGCSLCPVAIDDARDKNLIYQA